MRRAKRGPTDWHVTVRGARRLVLFRGKEDYLTFYGLLAEAMRRTGTRLHAQCLLGNHAHLCPHASSDQLSELMYRTDQPFSAYHNRKYGLSGHAFDRTYFAKEVPSPRILAFVSRYIHLNPVRASQVSRPEHYPWSSAGQLLGDAEGPIRVDPLPTLLGFAEDLEKARERYGQFVARGMQHPKALPSGGWSAMDVWQEEFIWILESVAAATERLAPLDPTGVAAWIGVRAGIPPRAIALALGVPSGRRISRRVYDLEKRLEAAPSLRERIRELGIL